MFTNLLEASLKVSAATLPPRNSTNYKPISIYDEEEIVSSNILPVDEPDGLTKAFVLSQKNNHRLKEHWIRTESRNKMKRLIYSPTLQGFKAFQDFSPTNYKDQKDTLSGLCLWPCKIDHVAICLVLSMPDPDSLAMSMWWNQTLHRVSNNITAFVDRRPF